MGNPLKALIGSVIGAGIGVAFSKLAGRVRQDDASTPRAIAGAPKPKETFRERIARARAAGDEAKAAKEAELRAYFRRKVDDPQALKDAPSP